MNNELFFIVASPRSGTTLLERLLNRHSRLFIPPETAFFNYLERYNLLNKAYDAERMYKFLPLYLRDRKFLGVGQEAIVEQSLLRDAKTYGDVFRNLLALLKRADGNKPRVGEKTPYHLEQADYLLNNFPQAKFLALIRDGRAVIRSRLTHPNWEHNLIDAALRWRKHARLLRKIKMGSEGDRIHIIYYERLILFPEDTLREICAFLNEEFETSMLDMNNPPPQPYQEYYQQPWMAKSNEPIDRNRANAWFEEYKLSELALVERLIAHELQHFNYELKAPIGAEWKVLYIKEWMRHHFYRISKRLRRLIVNHL